MLAQSSSITILTCLLPLLHAVVTSQKHVQRQFSLKPHTFSTSTPRYSRTITPTLQISETAFFTVAFWMRTSQATLSSYFSLGINGQLVFRADFDSLQSPTNRSETLPNGDSFEVVVHNIPDASLDWAFVHVQLSEQNQALLLRSRVNQKVMYARIDYFPRVDSLRMAFCGGTPGSPVLCDK